MEIDMTSTVTDWTLPYASHRSSVLGRNMVSTSQPLAAQAGLSMLLAGGNAAAPGVQIQLRSVADIIRWLGLVLRVQQDLAATPGEEPPCLAFRPWPTPAGTASREVCTFRLARPAEAVPTGVAFEIDYAGAGWRGPRYAEAAPDGSRRPHGWNAGKCQNPIFESFIE